MKSSKKVLPACKFACSPSRPLRAVLGSAFLQPESSIPAPRGSYSSEIHASRAKPKYWEIDFSPFARETLPLALEHAQGLRGVVPCSNGVDVTFIHTFRPPYSHHFFSIRLGHQNDFREATTRPTEVFLERESCFMIRIDAPDRWVAMTTPSVVFYVCPAPRFCILTNHAASPPSGSCCGDRSVRSAGAPDCS